MGPRSGPQKPRLIVYTCFNQPYVHHHHCQGLSAVMLLQSHYPLPLSPEFLTTVLPDASPQHRQAVFRRCRRHRGRFRGCSYVLLAFCYGAASTCIAGPVPTLL
ncbi:hypothetical protein DFH09DRAFT_1369310, partial [Mycena vulgaris]